MIMSRVSSKKVYLQAKTTLLITALIHTKYGKFQGELHVYAQSKWLSLYPTDQDLCIVKTLVLICMESDEDQSYGKNTHVLHKTSSRLSFLA